MVSQPISAPRSPWVTGPWFASLLWVSLVVAGWAIGSHLDQADPKIHIGAAPLVGTYDVRVGWRLLVPLIVGVAGAAWGPPLAARLSFGRLLALTWVGAAAWATALAASDGVGAITRPLTRRYEYLAAVDRVGSPGSFLRGFLDQLPSYPTHVRGHPPGMVLLLWCLDRIGLGGAQVAAALVIGVGALAAPAALVVLRDVSGDGQARGAAPFLALLPGAVWVATSADALFAAVLAIGLALLTLACGRRGRRSDALAIAAGLTFGAALMLSYGAVPFGALVLAVAAWLRRLRPLVLAGAAVLAVLGLFWALGFFWPDGLRATRELALAGVLTRRPYAAFLLISLAAFALAVGPAAAAGAANLRDRGTWVLAGAGLVAVAAADLSGLSRGETERIWLPFAPWVMLAATGLGRGWLGAQVLLGLALQAGVRSPW